MQKLQYRAYSKLHKKVYTIEELNTHFSFDLYRLMTHQYENLVLISSTGIFLDEDCLPQNEIFEGDVLKVSAGGVTQNSPHVVTSAAELYAEMNNSDGYCRISIIDRLTTIFDDPSMLKHIYPQDIVPAFMEGNHEL